MKRLFFVMSLLALLTACSDEPTCTKQVSADKINAVDQAQLQNDIIIIDDYLASKSIVATEDPSGVRMVITKAGDDTRPCLESQVTVKYAGRLLSGKGFDAAVNPVSFKLSELILGWQISFPNFGKGTKATLYIPSGFGYGVNGSGTTIPANSNLIFDIELISF
jgi:FKBP-type peptidyl-prolyl cis-trans isomerase FkpA